MQQKPLVTCSYGWKRTFVLYQDHLDVDGTIYSLDNLVHVRSIYRTVINIPSVRLELRFRKKDVVLRGIAAIDDAKKVIEYLDTYCSDTKRVTSHLHWSRTRQDEASPVQPLPTSVTSTTEAIGVVPASLLSFPALQEEVVGSDDRSMQDHAQAETSPIEAPSWLRDLDQHVVYTRQQQLTQANRSLRKYGSDLQERTQHAEATTLPSVSVPLRLHVQEVAHYCINATLCSETPVSSREQQMRFTYAATDHGKLILTNKRMIYMGRTGQLILDYAQLTHVSRLRNAIVFSADHWTQRHVLEMSRPLECAMYLDGILRQFQRQSVQNNVLTAQQSMNELAQRHTYVHSTRTTQPRYAAYSRQMAAMRPIKPAIELADVETLSLSMLNHAEMEVVE